ncbi:MAG: septum formation initiator family protein [Deltaproteobacteria bacterium]|nr:septum formation initiator family protein [Deltaproteobacteria bacterium]
MNLQKLPMITVASVLGGLLFFWALVFGDQGVVKLFRLYQLKEHLLEEQSTLARELDRLNTEKAMLEEPRQMEMIVRQELGVIKPGEILFQELPKEPKESPEEKKDVLPRESKISQR